MEEQKKHNIPQEIPCFLCGDFQKLLLTKNNKPYFICNTCGIQAFIRKTEGITRLEDLIRDSELKEIYYKGSFIKNSHLFRIKERMNLIKEALSRLAIILISEKDILLEKALRSNLKRLEAQYNNYLNKLDN